MHKISKTSPLYHGIHSIHECTLRECLCNALENRFCRQPFMHSGENPFWPPPSEMFFFFIESRKKYFIFLLFLGEKRPVAATNIEPFFCCGKVFPFFMLLSTKSSNTNVPLEKKFKDTIYKASKGYYRCEYAGYLSFSPLCNEEKEKKKSSSWKL